MSRVLGLHFTLIFYSGALFSFFFWYKYDDMSFSFYTPCGPYRVGFKDFVAKEMGNECSIFYPAMNDDSGTLGVPFMPWGDEEARGFH
jgi:hypothetical protein